jgi:hypothetical protein
MRCERESLYLDDIHERHGNLRLGVEEEWFAESLCLLETRAALREACYGDLGDSDMFVQFGRAGRKRKRAVSPRHHGIHRGVNVVK